MRSKSKKKNQNSKKIKVLGTVIFKPRKSYILEDKTLNKYKLGEIVPTYNIEKQIIAIKLLLAKNRKNDIKKTAIKNFTWDVQSNKFMQIILGHS